MKNLKNKIGISILSITSILILSGCSTIKNDHNQNTDNLTTATKISSSSTQNDKISFKDGVIETKTFKLKIDKTQVGHDNFSKTDGIIVWYTLTNKSDTNIVPDDIISQFKFKQSDGNSIYELSDDFKGTEALYPMYDSNGDPLSDTDLYNNNLEKQKAMSKNEVSQAELLPRKSISYYVDCSLNNKDNNVEMTLDSPTESSSNSYIININ